MPKININAALNNETTENRKKLANQASSVMTAGAFDLLNDRSKLQVKSIPIEKLKAREVNEFSEVDVSTLAESIRLYGLINPLSVVHHEDEDIYVVSAGHRRLKAIQTLHAQYPDDPKFKEVDCAVYEVTTDEFKLSQGLPFITPEQEEGIYRDSNLENRQLSYEDVAHQIRTILNKFDDPDYVERLRQYALQSGVKTRMADTDKVKLIESVLSSQNFSGWSRETIRQVIKVKEAGREDLLEQIEQGLPVNNAYKKVVAEQKKTRKRKTNKITSLDLSVSEFEKEAQNRRYSDADIEKIKKYIQILQKIVDTNNYK